MIRKQKKYWASAGLLAVMLLSVWVWREYRVRYIRVESSDNFNYLAYGRALIESRHPNFEPWEYEDFSKGVEIPKLAVYPNQLYALSAAGLCKAFAVPPATFALWPLWGLNILATAAGFGFLFLLFRRFLPEREVWLATGLLWISPLLMVALVRPFSDVAGWCLAMGLLWLAASRRGSPWMLGALFGAAVLFRLQLLYLLPFLIRLRQPEGALKRLVVPFLKACAAAGVVLLVFEAAMRIYVRAPEGALRGDALGNASYYADDMRFLFSNFGNWGGAFSKAGMGLARLLNPVSGDGLGLAWLLSLGVWLRRPATAAQKQVRTLWLAAVCGTVLPLLMYASVNHVAPPARYQIYSIPLYVLTALVVLNAAADGVRTRGFRIALGCLPVVVLAGLSLVALREKKGLQGRPRHAGLHAVYADYENFPQLLARLNMPANGLYLVKPTLEAVLPRCRMILRPSQSEFNRGARNDELDGIICRARGKAIWDDEAPVIEDDRGVRFERVYVGRGTDRLLIYKRTAP